MEALSLILSGVAMLLGGRKGYGLDWPIGSAAMPETHKNISSLGHVGVGFSHV